MARSAQAMLAEGEHPAAVTRIAGLRGLAPTTLGDHPALRPALAALG